MKTVGIISFKSFVEKLASKLEDVCRLEYMEPSRLSEKHVKNAVSGRFLLIAEVPELIHCNSLLAKKLKTNNIDFVPMGFKHSPHLINTSEQFNCPFVITEETTIRDLKKNINTYFDGKDGELPVKVKFENYEPDPGLLHPTEYEVMYWLCHDLTAKEIAHLIDKSPRTIDNVRARLMRKLGVNGIAGLVKWAYDHGVVYPFLGKKFYNRF